MGESRKGRDSSVKEPEGEVMRRGRREGVEKKGRTWKEGAKVYLRRVMRACKVMQAGRRHATRGVLGESSTFTTIF